MLFVDEIIMPYLADGGFYLFIGLCLSQRFFPKKLRSNSIHLQRSTYKIGQVGLMASLHTCSNSIMHIFCNEYNIPIKHIYKIKAEM